MRGHAEAKLKTLRDLCGGEDPVEALERLRTENRALTTMLERVVEVGHPVWLMDEARALLARVRGVTNSDDSETQKRKTAEQDRDSLLDLVQRLLDHSPGGKAPYFLHGTEELPEVLLPDGRWASLREEARARVAEMKGPA